ncbi:MAG: flavodoxin family protein [Candidatus Ancillula sp.]|jgi:multimeric flavodoxin WrbA|nr:flavodoxin family protein [Candidatus Ancillula sp.]
MKVLLINGSPHPKGCTYRALSEVAKAIEVEGVETQIFDLKTGPFESCRACGYCKKNNRCIIDDAVNQIAELAEESDGFIFGTPVHYAGISGAIKCVLDRLYTSNSSKLAYKPGAAIVSCRRSGSTATLDNLNKYFTINNQPVVSSQYWNQVHGANVEDVEQDKEGLQIMRQLGKNMAWLIKSIEIGKKSGVSLPTLEEDHEQTNFIH